MAIHHPGDNAPPDERVEAIEGVLRHRIPEIVGPATLDLIDPRERGPERDL